MGEKRRSSRMQPLHHWINSLKDIPCFLIGNGPSLRKVDLSPLEDYFTIGLNRVFLKIQPTILMWQDLSLWLKEKKAVKRTKAIKFCRLGADTRGGYYYFKLIGKEHRLTRDPSNIYGRGSSGPIGFQLAHILGCDPIFLVGMDCCYGRKGLTDFYGNNPMHRNHTIPYCKLGLKWIKKCKHGRRVINCSNNDIFPEKMTLEEAIDLVKNKKYTREELEKKILGK